MGLRFWWVAPWVDRQSSGPNENILQEVLANVNTPMLLVFLFLTENHIASNLIRKGVFP